MFIHCKPYKCNIYLILSAVSAILLGALYAFDAKGASTARKPRIALLGDSMTWIGGDSCQNETGWSHVLRESGVASDIDVYARSGATWTNTTSTRRNPEYYSEVLHDDNVVYNQAIRLIERADTAEATPEIIILFAGANDAWFADRRPGIYEKEQTPASYGSDTDPACVTSLTGSVCLVCDMLQTRFPDSELVLVSPLQMSKTDEETILKVARILEDTGKSRGCKVIRADLESGIRHSVEAVAPTFTYDGVHTNSLGAKAVGECILFHLLNDKPENSTTDNPHSPTTIQPNK